MESESIAHALPERYRALLDRIALLELDGARGEADHIRREAIRIYSASWDARAIRHLEALTRRADRVLNGVDRPRREAARPSLQLPRLRYPAA
jgi:hypothetical protein